MKAKVISPKLLKKHRCYVWVDDGELMYCHIGDNGKILKKSDCEVRIACEHFLKDVNQFLNTRFRVEDFGYECRCKDADGKQGGQS